MKYCLRAPECVDTPLSIIGFEMCMIVVEAIRERCASFMVLAATV